jgi:Subtilase family
LSPKPLCLMLALLVAASIAGRTSFIRYLYEAAKVPAALAGGHGNAHGNSGNENGNAGGNGNSNAGGNGNGNGNNGLGNGNSGRGDDDSGSKSVPPGQDDLIQTGWQGSSLPDFGNEKKSWENYLKAGIQSDFVSKTDFEKSFAPKDMKEGAGRNPPPASQAAKEGSQRQHRNGTLAGIDPGSYSPTEVLAINLTSMGAAHARRLGFQIRDAVPAQENGPVTILIAPGGADALNAMALLQENLPSEHFQLNRLYRLYRPAMKDDGEPRSSRPAALGGKNCAGDHCYARAAIQWKDSLASCAQNVKVGVIDADIDLKHPAFRQQNITQKLLIPAGRQAAAGWHGTGVLALLAGRPDSGTPGLIPEARFFAAGIFYADDHGDAVTDTVSVLRALDWMAASGAKLVNMSFSGPQDNLVQAKIESLSANKGLVFSAAAGNDGPAAEPAYPAAYPQVIAVTAVTKEFKNYPFANRGGHIDVAAPGVDIWTAWPDAREGYRSGTSFASPFVTAVLAILPPDTLKRPKESLFGQLRTADLGQPGRDPVYGRGLLQAPASCPMASGESADNTQGWTPRSN